MKRSFKKGKMVLGNDILFVEEYVAFCRVQPTYSHFLPRILFSEFSQILLGYTMSLGLHSSHL